MIILVVGYMHDEHCVLNDDIIIIDVLYCDT